MVKRFERVNAINSEHAKIVSQFAPGDDRPASTPKPKPERMYDALGYFLFGIGIIYFQA